MKVLIITLSYLIEYQNIDIIDYNENYMINRVYFKPVNNLGVKQICNLSNDNKIINNIKDSKQKGRKKLNYSEISQYLKVMADSSRLEILDLLSCGELCACDLLQHFSFLNPH